MIFQKPGGYSRSIRLAELDGAILGDDDDDIAMEMMVMMVMILIRLKIGVQDMRISGHEELGMPSFLNRYRSISV